MLHWPFRRSASGSDVPSDGRTSRAEHRPISLPLLQIRPSMMGSYNNASPSRSSPSSASPREGTSRPGDAPNGRPSVAWKSSLDLAAMAGGLPLSSRMQQQQQQQQRQMFLFPVSKSASLPTSSSPANSNVAPPNPRPNPAPAGRLQISTSFSRSNHPGRYDQRHADISDWNRYPIVPHLSPIAEQDYISPESLRASLPLPSSPSESPEYASPMSYTQTPMARKESQRSDITRPSPVYSHHQAFLSRPVNRSISQTSSRTHQSTSSSIINSAVTPITAAPSIPPLDFSPAFPGPHPANTVDGAVPRRVPRSTYSKTPIDDDFPVLSPITGSSEAHSLHAESFVTATESVAASSGHVSRSVSGDASGEEVEMDEMDVTDSMIGHPPDLEGQTSARSSRRGSREDKDSHPPPRRSASASRAATASPQSVSSSFIHRRWDKAVATFGTGNMAIPPKLRDSRPTPACLLFWMGMCCPLLWLFGGWYFTIYQETGMTWSSLMKSSKWGSSRVGRRSSSSNTRTRDLILPQWAMYNINLTERSISQLPDYERRSIEKLRSGYPFIREPSSTPPPPVETSQGAKSSPFRFLSRVPLIGIDLIGPDEEWSTKRRLDPWIWRCRVAAVLFAIASVIVAVVMIAIYLPRALR